MSEEFDPTTMLQNLGISITAEDRAVIPSEGIDFGAGSIIAQWSAGIYYWFLTNVDYLIHNRDSEEKVAAPQIRKSKADSGWFDMYYSDYVEALDAYYRLEPTAKDEKYKPTAKWVFSAPVSTVLGRTPEQLENMAKGFGDPIILDTRVMALRKGSSRYPLRERHEFGLLALPCAVAAIADVLGIPNVGFDISELTQENAKDQFSDEFFAANFGSIEGGYEESVYYQRRAALWKSLGEDNPKASAMIGSVTASGKPNRQATTSERLSTCLAVAQGKWTKPLYARVVTVPNPMPNKKDGEHYSLGILGEIFKSPEEARTAASGTDENAAPDHPPLGGWAGGKPEDVVNHITAAQVDENNNPIGSIIDQMEGALPPQKARLVADAFLDSWEDLVAWADYAKGQG